MKINSLYQASVMEIPAFHTLLDAAGQMRSLDIGALAVLDGDVLRGIITERDLVQAMSDEADPRSTLVASYMSTGPVTAHPDDDSAEVVRRMLEAGVRHLAGDGRGPGRRDGLDAGSGVARGLAAGVGRVVHLILPGYRIRCCIFQRG